jgi:hypothetical protein
MRGEIVYNTKAGLYLPRPRGATAEVLKTQASI